MDRRRLRLTRKNTLCLLVLNNLFKLIDEVDEQEEEIIIKVATTLKNKILRPQIALNYLHLVDNYPPEVFRKHFRINRKTFGFLFNEFKRSLINRGFGRKTIDPKLQLLITLWFFANCNSYREIVSRFHVGLATAIRAIRRVVFVLFAARDRFIYWPDNPLNNCHAFEDLYGFPKVVGCIDGTHINIPLYCDGQQYINRKNNASIQLQVVSDHNLKFIHVYAGQVGSVHDARVLRLSGVQDICNDITFFPENSHILGDAAYPNQQHLLVPFKNNGHLTAEQTNFNTTLSSARLTENQMEKIII